MAKGLEVSKHLCESGHHQGTVMDFHAGLSADERTYILCCQRAVLWAPAWSVHGKKGHLMSWSTALGGDPQKNTCIWEGGGGQPLGPRGADNCKKCYWVNVMHMCVTCALKSPVCYTLRSDLLRRAVAVRRSTVPACRICVWRQTRTLLWGSTWEGEGFFGTGPLPEKHFIGCLRILKTSADIRVDLGSPPSPQLPTPAAKQNQLHVWNAEHGSCNTHHTQARKLCG